jgi:hypothetical protein
LTGIGLTGVGVGTVFGLLAADKKNASAPDCVPLKGCYPSGASLMREADRDAWVSNIAFGAGGASLAVAAYLFFAPRTFAAPSRIRGRRPRKTTRPVKGLAAIAARP